MNSEHNRRAGRAEDRLKHDIGVNPGHVFAVNGGDLIAGFETGRFSRGASHGGDDGQKIARRIYISADAFVAAVKRHGGLFVFIRAHVRGVFVAERIHHPADGTFHQLGVINGLIYKFFMHKLPRLPEGFK